MQSFVWGGRGLDSLGSDRRGSWVSTNLGHHGQMMFLNRMASVHSKHQQGVEKNRNSLAFRQLHASSPDIHMESSNRHHHSYLTDNDTNIDLRHTVTKSPTCPRLKIVRSAILDPQTSSSDTTQAFLPNCTYSTEELIAPRIKRDVFYRNKSSSDAHLPKLLVTMHPHRESDETDVFIPSTDKLICLGKPEHDVECSGGLHSAMSCSTDIGLSQLKDTDKLSLPRILESRRKSAQSILSTKYLDHNLPPLSLAEYSLVKKKKMKHKLYICGYLMLVLLFVTAVVYLSAHGVFYTQAQISSTST